ncbi:hypothetical protein C5C00_03895 [Rathayibacter rathayi]|nr:hypothetical protein C5C00_03895 [Rathayibacter rathayi]
MNGWHLLATFLVYGFFPGLFARLISLCFHKDDPRRAELIAEVYAVPRWERPAWVLEQFERALSEGVWERVWDAADGRLFNRWTLGDGRARHQKHPDSFWAPSDAELELLEPGDVVKLMFECKGRRTYGLDGCSGERMWVVVTAIDGERFEGTLSNQPAVWNHLEYGDKIKFSAKHITDYDYRGDEEGEIAA